MQPPPPPPPMLSSNGFLPDLTGLTGRCWVTLGTQAQQRKTFSMKGQWNCIPGLAAHNQEADWEGTKGLENPREFWSTSLC